MAELESRKSDKLYIDYKLTHDCAENFKKLGDEYQQIADTFYLEIGKLKTDDILSSKFMNQEFETMVNEVAVTLDSLKQRCNQYAQVLENTISSFQQADTRVQ